LVFGLHPCDEARKGGGAGFAPKYSASALADIDDMDIKVHEIDGQRISVYYG
jgi:hypothetical protein